MSLLDRTRIKEASGFINNSFGNPFQGTSLRELEASFIGHPYIPTDHFTVLAGHPQNTVSENSEYLDNTLPDYTYDIKTYEGKYSIYLFFSEDGLWLGEIRRDLIAGNNEIAIFIETDNDNFNRSNIKIKVGKDAKLEDESLVDIENILNHQDLELEQSQIQEMLDSLNHQNKVVPRFIEFIRPLLGDLGEIIADVQIFLLEEVLKNLVNHIRIDEETWNVQLSDSGQPDFDEILFLVFTSLKRPLKEIKRAVNDSSASANVKRPIVLSLDLLEKYLNLMEVMLAETLTKPQSAFALYCGVWNGLIDFLAGIIDSAILASKGQKELASNAIATDLLFEAIENLFDRFLKQDFEQIKKSLGVALSDLGEFLTDVPEAAYEWRKGLNRYERYYYFGYSASIIGQFIFPETWLRILGTAELVGVASSRIFRALYRNLRKTRKRGFDTYEIVDSELSTVVDRINQSRTNTLRPKVDQESLPVKQDLKRIEQGKSETIQDALKEFERRSIDLPKNKKIKDIPTISTSVLISRIKDLVENMRNPQFIPETIEDSTRKVLNHFRSNLKMLSTLEINNIQRLQLEQMQREIVDVLKNPSRLTQNADGTPLHPKNNVVKGNFGEMFVQYLRINQFEGRCVFLTPLTTTIHSPGHQGIDLLYLIRLENGQLVKVIEEVKFSGAPLKSYIDLETGKKYKAMSDVWLELRLFKKLDREIRFSLALINTYKIKTDLYFSKEGQRFSLKSHVLDSNGTKIREIKDLTKEIK